MGTEVLAIVGLGPHPKPPLKTPKPYLSLVYWDSEIKLDAELSEEFQLTDAEFALRDMPVPTIGSCDGKRPPAYSELFNRYLCIRWCSTSTASARLTSSSSNANP
jgi:hypothetical protein